MPYAGGLGESAASPFPTPTFPSLHRSPLEPHYFRAPTSPPLPGTRARPRGPPPLLAGCGDRWPATAQGGAASALRPLQLSPHPPPVRPPRPRPAPPPRSPHSSRGRTRQSPRTNSAASGDGAGPREARARSFLAPSSRPGRVIPGH